jgi:hypothetical protein
VQHHSYLQKNLIDLLPVGRDVDSLRKDVHESSVEGREIGWGGIGGYLIRFASSACRIATKD